MFYLSSHFPATSPCSTCPSPSATWPRRTAAPRRRWIRLWPRWEDLWSGGLGSAATAIDLKEIQWAASWGRRWRLGAAGWQLGSAGVITVMNDFLPTHASWLIFKSFACISRPWKLLCVPFTEFFIHGRFLFSRSTNKSTGCREFSIFIYFNSDRRCWWKSALEIRRKHIFISLRDKNAFMFTSPDFQLLIFLFIFSFFWSCISLF